MSWGKNQRKLNSILISLLQNLVRYVFLIPRSLRLWLVSLVSREMSDYSGVFQRPIFTNKHKYKCILLTYLLTGTYVCLFGSSRHSPETNRKREAAGQSDCSDQFSSLLSSTIASTPEHLRVAAFLQRYMEMTN